jgi:hypothetical protein
MKLRKIDSHRYCDDETGTYFQFPLFDLSQQEAEKWIRADMECFLGQYPSEDYFGTDRLILELGRSVPPPQT